MIIASNLLLLAALCLAALCVWRQRKCWLLIWQLNGWRGLLQQPLLWLLVLLFMDPKSLLEVTRRLRKYFKRPLAVYVGRCVLLYVDDPVTMEQILNAPECVDKSMMQDGFFARKGLLHAKGQKWKIRRKQLNPTFSTNILLSFFPTFNATAERLQKKFADLHGDVVKFKDVEDVLSRAVLEVACQTTMGTEMNFIAEDKEDIARTYKKLLEISAVKIVKPWLQIDCLFRLLNRKLYDCDRTSNRLLANFVSNIVQRKHGAWKQRQPDVQHEASSAATRKYVEDSRDGVGSTTTISTTTTTSSSSTTTDIMDDISTPAKEVVAYGGSSRKRIFIEQIFHLAERGELTLQDIMDESQSMVLVAFETVSNNVLIALLLLAMHPDCQDKLRHEIWSIVPPPAAATAADPTKTNDPNSEDISNEHLKQMKYLDMVVNESLRLMATVPMNLRNVSRDFALTKCGTDERNDARSVRNERERKGDVDGRAAVAAAVIVPEGTIVALDIFNMQRDVEHWGSRSHEFHPEHFEVAEEQQMKQNVGNKKENRVWNEQEQAEQAPGSKRHPYAFGPFSRGLRTCIGARYSIWLTKILLIRILQRHEFGTATQLHDLRYVEGISLKFQNSDNIAFSIRAATANESKNYKNEHE